MRERKFRAWNKRIKKIYNAYEIDLKHKIAKCESAKQTTHTFGFIDLELMQYTGLKDKKRQEIYEGDIVKCRMSSEHHSLPHMGEIVYVETFGAFATKNEAGETLLHNHALNTFEVIGNIYENPELMEK